METGLKEIVSLIDRYLIPLMASDHPGNLSKEENRILILQQINRLNQRIGQIARTNSKRMGDMKTLQTQVNNLTIGVKNDNVPQMKNSFTSVRNLIETLDSSDD